MIFRKPTARNSWRIETTSATPAISAKSMRTRGVRAWTLLLATALLATNAAIVPPASHAAGTNPTMELPFEPLDGQKFMDGAVAVLSVGVTETRVAFQFEITGPFTGFELSVSPSLGFSGFQPVADGPYTCFPGPPMTSKGGPPLAGTWTNPTITPPVTTCNMEDTDGGNVFAGTTKIYLETMVSFPSSAGDHKILLDYLSGGAYARVGSWTIQTQEAPQQDDPPAGGGQCPFVIPDRTIPNIRVSEFNLTTMCAEYNTFVHGSDATFVSSINTFPAEFFFTPKHDIKSVSYAVTGTMNLASISMPGNPQQCPDSFELAGQTVMASDNRVCTFTPTDPITTAVFATMFFVALLRVPDPNKVETLTVAVTYVDGSATPSESFSWNVMRTSTAAPQQQQQGSAAPQLPVVLSPQGVARAIATPGSVWGMIGGKPATTIVNAPTVGKLNAQIGTVELSLTAPEVNGSPLSGGGFVAKGGDLDIAATGFFPFSAVRVWSVSEQRLLATSVVSADGTVDLDVTLPDRPNACRETVQISGSNASAEQIAASLTLRYALDNPFANETGAAELHAGALACLANRGVMSGVSADHAAADRVITRAQVAALITRALELTGQTAIVSDVNQNVHQDAIRAAIAAGLFTPFEDGTFRPDMPVTRAELARIIATAANLQPAETTSFTDINGETARLAEALRQAGIVRGTTDARFNPDQFATRAQTASIIDNLLALIESSR